MAVMNRNETTNINLRDPEALVEFLGLFML
jgi:hypothetical protein